MQSIENVMQGAKLENTDEDAGTMHVLKSIGKKERFWD